MFETNITEKIKTNVLCYVTFPQNCAVCERMLKSVAAPDGQHKLLTIKFANFDIRGIVHSVFVPTGQTVNQVYYLEVLKRLRKKVRRK